MTLTESQLEEISELASLFFSPQDIAIITGLDVDQLLEEIATEQSSANLAYLRGKLKARASVRKTIKNLAIQGSSPAQNLVLKMMEEQDYHEEINTGRYGKTY
ncbi:hypothetical protein [Telluribacter humicola]|uniref:hypothetical protein n=1 Tax=Telluribacter humicola TaxID=1720261 RepID=UPI001A97CAA9|nr:hypothetical protein [Telluribacter humicola]